ncbi:hypothetical protein E2C01_012421 [Portunus trituberculatus]|uniref:Uncharacterized protein n=1 Tax=Portunus trituberculatus TaxID=210409 RepID=A0A5B7DEH9_PORTR|nr:hypothetical protein [Portunus trituberculatus]
MVKTQLYALCYDTNTSEVNSSPNNDSYRRKTMSVVTPMSIIVNSGKLGAGDERSEGRTERHDPRGLGEDGVQGLGQVVLHHVPLEDVLASEGLGTHGAGVRAVVGLRG